MKQVVKISRLPACALKIIESYANLPTPYYINRSEIVPHRPEERYQPKRALNRVRLAKGSPEDIKNFSIKLAKKSTFDFDNASVESKANFMFRHGIGIDCSGFVLWVLNEVTKQKLNKKFWKCIHIPSEGILKKLNTLLRPIPNISVMTIKENSFRINNLKDARAGDVIITYPPPSLQHIILITEVGYDKNNIPLYMCYAQATDWYSPIQGIQHGRINIKHPNKYLVEQEWKQVNVKKNHTYEGVKYGTAPAEIMRLKFLTT